MYNLNIGAFVLFSYGPGHIISYKIACGPSAGRTCNLVGNDGFRSIHSADQSSLSVCIHFKYLATHMCHAKALIRLRGCAG